MDTYLEKAILHIIDQKAGTLTFSEKELDLAAEYVRTYLAAKVSKPSTIQTRTGALTEDGSFIDTLRGVPGNSIKRSQGVTQHQYGVYSGNGDAPNADISFVLYKLGTVLHVAMIKLNHKESYMHYVDYEEESVYSKLIINRAILFSKP